MFRKSNARKSLPGVTLHLPENKHNKSTLLYIICGYKPYLQKKVFERFIKYFNVDADVCLLSSGKFDQSLFDLAKQNNWSYMTTTLNNISAAQNAVILTYDKAQTIIKMDEDIFVTEGVFKKLLDVKEQLDKDQIKYSFIAPLLNVNGFASVKYLELIGKKEMAESKFGHLKYCYGWRRCLAENNANFVKFLWNQTNELFQLDEANTYLNNLQIDDYIVCNNYFSIGLIVFNRSFWEKIGLFYVYKKSINLGTDEFFLNWWGKYTKYKRIICQKTICGHFSFTPTNKEMKEFYIEHEDLF